MITCNNRIECWRYIQAIVLCLMLAACSKSATVNHDSVIVSVLAYQEQEAGTEPYPVRVLVDPHFVRFDDGYDASDFALLERESLTIFSISHDEQNILVINHRSHNTTLPAGIVLQETINQESPPPMIAGLRPVHIEYLANDAVCFQAISVPGLMQEAVLGLTEFATALGDRQLDELKSVPESMQTPCFLTRYGYSAGRHYKHGLPAQEWDEDGNSRRLTDFKEGVSFPAEIFELPAGYSTFRIGG